MMALRLIGVKTWFSYLFVKLAFARLVSVAVLLFTASSCRSEEVTPEERPTAEPGSTVWQSVELALPPIDLPATFALLDQAEVFAVFIDPEPAAELPVVYEYHNGSQSETWEAQGHQVSIFPSNSSEPRFIQDSSGRVIGLGSEDLDALVAAIDEINDAGPPFVVVSDYRLEP
jgi:hypothetical protein